MPRGAGLTSGSPWAVGGDKFNEGTPWRVISLGLFDLRSERHFSEVDLTNISSSDSFSSFPKLVLCRCPRLTPSTSLARPFCSHSQTPDPIWVPGAAGYCKYCTRHTDAKKKHSLFIENANLTGCPVLLLAKSGIPNPNDLGRLLC